MLVDALDTDENEDLLPLLRVAKEWGRPPLTVIAERPDIWRLDDTLLAAAYEEYEATRVGPSGLPLRRAADGGDADSWTVDADTVDYAQTALNRWVEGRPVGDVEAVIPRLGFHRTIPPWER